MSFRARLLLFFVIIVVIPMIAVALVLFSLTRDSEVGKTDAQIAQGLRTAFASFDQSRADARERLESIASDQQLGSALADGNVAEARTRARALARENDVAALAIYDSGGKLVAFEGDKSAIASAVARPTTEDGRRVGSVALSITPAQVYAREVARLTGLDVRVARDKQILASTIEERGPPEIESGEVEINGAEYRGRFARVPEAIGEPVEVGVFVENADVAGSISDSRILIGAILAAFLLLALLSSVVVVRALQRQVDQFLGAARRLGTGEFSRPVPVDCND